MDEGHGVWVGSFPLFLLHSLGFGLGSVFVYANRSPVGRELPLSAQQTCFCDEVLQMLPDTVKPRTGRSHAYTLKYFFLVPKDDDDDETLFDLNTFFFTWGHKRTESEPCPKTSERLFTPFSARSVSTNRHFRWPAPPAHDSH